MEAGARLLLLVPSVSAGVLALGSKSLLKDF